MHYHYDEDEWESVHHSSPCTYCGGDLKKCTGGMCNGSSGLSVQRRPAAQVAAIKAERQRQHEEKVLAEAEAIKARRKASVPQTDTSAR